MVHDKHPLICSCTDCIKKAYKKLVDTEKKEKLEKRRQELLDKQVIVTCETCGSKRKLPVSRAKTYKYCSKSCHNIGMKKERKGKMWYEYSKQKGRVMRKIIKVRIAKKYKHDLAEGIIRILSDIHNIGTEYVQTDTDEIILNIYPYNDRTFNSLMEFAINSEYFDKIY